MQCGKEGSFSQVGDANLTCNPLCSKQELKEIKPTLKELCVKLNASSACCKMILHIQAASRGYCKHEKCNDDYCKNRHNPTDKKCIDIMQERETTTAESVNESTTVVPNPTIKNGNGATDVETQGPTTTRDGTGGGFVNIMKLVSSGGTINIMKLVYFFDLSSAILFQMLLLTFVLINSSV
jgi:hypothetical protein